MNNVRYYQKLAGNIKPRTFSTKETEYYLEIFPLNKKSAIKTIINYGAAK